jgi:hypothetical protein
MPFGRVGVMPQPNEPSQSSMNEKAGGGLSSRQKGITMEVRRLISFLAIDFVEHVVDDRYQSETARFDGLFSGFIFIN